MTYLSFTPPQERREEQDVVIQAQEKYVDDAAPLPFLLSYIHEAILNITLHNILRPTHVCSAPRTHYAPSHAHTFTQHHAASRSITQYHAVSRSITQYHAVSRSITQHHAAPRSITQHHAAPLSTTLTHYHSLSLTITHYHSLLGSRKITQYRPYHHHNATPSTI